MKPSFIPEVDSKYTKKERKTIAQVWHKNGECPKNTVPIRKTKKEDILRAKFIKSFGRKTHQNVPEYNPSQGHEYAIMNSRIGKFYGKQFSVSVWNPNVQVREEFSLSQTWLLSGEGPNLNTIEAGWQVYPGKYGDSNTRLFVFWTRDNYKTTRCYNLDCPVGFVQSSNRISVTGSLAVSQYDGEQNELPMLIWKDGENWWLKIGEELVGYWPGKLFTSLGDGARKVQWGGEIVNNMVDGRHTTTDMGSGHFAEEGFKKASYFTNIMIFDGTNALKEPAGLSPYVTNGGCYNISPGNGGTTAGSYFYYGGPGQNDKCP